MLKSLSILFISSLALVLLAGGGARADFYKYVDEEGVVHITNVPTSKKYKWVMKEERSAYRPLNLPKGGNYDTIINDTAGRYGIDPSLVKAIVKAESDFNPTAVSHKGARGLMQLMPETSRLMGVRDIHDPQDNVEGGIRYLSKLLKMFDWKVPLAVAAYNAGENAVLRYGNIPPYSETQTYVRKVLHYYDVYRNSER